MKARIQIGAAILIVATKAAALSDLTSESKVVFLKGTEVWSVDADGSNQKVLTHDAVPKDRPVWSPDGTKIAYVTASSAQSVSHPPNALALINVIAADGRPVKTIPVPAAMPDGTPILGMRSVEDSGWFSNSAVFVSGSENPHYAEYHIFEVPAGKLVHSYAGYEFATCPSQAEVAFIADSDEANPEKLHVQVNGKDVLEVAADSEPRNFQWSSDCDRLAFLADDGDVAKLVVLRKNAVEARIPIGAEFSAASLTPVGHWLLLEEVGQTKYYDVSVKAFATAPRDFHGMPPANPQRSVDELAKRLGGTSANVWSPKQK